MIGESSTPLANFAARRTLRWEFDLPFLLPFCKWREAGRKIIRSVCGLKRSSRFIIINWAKPLQNKFRSRESTHGRRKSQSEKIADTHWYCPDLDHFLVRKAQELGVIYHHETELESATVRKPAGFGLADAETAAIRST